jgi:hypothetical protein
VPTGWNLKAQTLLVNKKAEEILDLATNHWEDVLFAHLSSIMQGDSLQMELREIRLCHM